MNPGAVPDTRAAPFRSRFTMPELIKHHFATTALVVADGLARILAVITLENVNTALATVIAALSIAHLIIKIRKDSRK